MFALRHGHVRNQQVGGQVARSECAVGGLQQREARNAAGVGLAFAQRQPVSMQPPPRVQGKTQH